jgi:hypothetical protein
MNVYAENKDVLRADDACHGRQHAGREFGAGPDQLCRPADRPDLFVEVRRRKIGPIFSFLVSGTFF